MGVWGIYLLYSLRRIFEPKGEEVVGGFRRLHNEGLHNLDTSSNIIRIRVKEDEIHRTCNMYGGDEKCIQEFVQKM